MSKYTIDYFLTNDDCMSTKFDTVDLHINFSDHVPISICCWCILRQSNCTPSKEYVGTNRMFVPQLRWDRADLGFYRLLTGSYFQSVLQDTINLEKTKDVHPDDIDSIYSRLVNILRVCSDTVVPACPKKFFKYWWDQEMDELKQRSMDSCQVWKAVGSPRSGSVFDKYRRDKMAYKNGIRNRQRNEMQMYTNDLHEALMQKQGTAFWKCWNAKFGKDKSDITIVDGVSDVKTIVSHFAAHFSKVCTNSTVGGSETLKSAYNDVRHNYCGQIIDDSYLFDAELVERVISRMKRGKAAGFDNITSEHLQFSHPLLPVILSKLFNCMMDIGHVPECFGQSYTVPIPKASCNVRSKSVTVNDFRGISISPVISKVLEHCILDRYSG